MRVVQSQVTTEDDAREGNTRAISLEYDQFITMGHFRHLAILSLWETIISREGLSGGQKLSVAQLVNEM